MHYCSLIKVVSFLLSRKLLAKEKRANSGVRTQKGPVFHRALVVLRVRLLVASLVVYLDEINAWDGFSFEKQPEK